MAIARRALLGLGAAAATSWATASCRPGERRERRRIATPTATSSPRVTPEKVSPAAAAAFPGQPRPGSLYYGASVPHGRSLAAWEKRLGSRLALHRSYFTPDANETAQLVRRCRLDLALDRMPHVSIKPPGTWRAVGRGAYDDWLARLLGPLGVEDAALFFTLHHEPENDAGGPGMTAADYATMQRRVIRLAAELAPQVTVVPVLQHWTFDPSRVDVDPDAWIVPEARVLGFDVYNSWAPGNGKPWRTFGSLVDEVAVWRPNVPLVIGEYGCREDPAIPGLATDWLRDAAAYARTHDIVSMSYFNSRVGSQDGSWRLSGSMEQAFAELLASDWVARPG